MNIPYYKTFIAALIHNPNAIGGYEDYKVIKKDRAARKALTLWKTSCEISRNEFRGSVWDYGYPHNSRKLYPPFPLLFALVTNKVIDNEKDEVNKLELFKHFWKEFKILKGIYKSIEPDKDTLLKKPRLIDLFGFVHEVPEKSFPEMYFKDILDNGANIRCPHCKIISVFIASEKFKFKSQPTMIIKYQHPYQCQTCGKVKMGNVNYQENSLEELCECNGFYRRDKSLICKTCTQKERRYIGGGLTPIT